MSDFLEVPDQPVVVNLAARVGHHQPAHVLDRASALAINAALATGRPLLVRGEPGVGKSQLAHAAALALHRVLLRHTVDARTEPRDLLYTIDAVARLAEAQIIGAMRGTGVDAAARIALERFVHPGMLWWAFDWQQASEQCRRASGQPQRRPVDIAADAGAVLLIDEIDKADSSIPNALLDALGHRSFEVEACGSVVMKASAPPLVVVTTNEERALPDAFLRRCFVLHLGLPDDPRDLTSSAVRQDLVARGQAHFPTCRPAVLARAAELIATRRAAMRKDRLSAPGVAEYIDLVDAVLRQRSDGAAALALLDDLAPYVLHKHTPPGGQAG